MDRQKKLNIAKSKISQTPPTAQVGFFQAKDLEDIHTKFSAMQDTLIKLIDALQQTNEKNDKTEVVNGLEKLNNSLSEAIVSIEGSAGVRDKSVIEAISEIAEKINIPEYPNTIKVGNPFILPKWLQSPDAITKVYDQLTTLTETLKPSQEPGNFLPYRRVRKLGNRLVFDDSDWAATAGGGGGGVQELGADNMATGQVSVNGTATSIKAARAGRRGVLVTNLGSVDVYLGADSGVTTGTGSLLLGTKGTAIFVPTTTAIYGITAGSTVNVSYIEVY